MMARMQIVLDPETQRRARRKASDLGVSLAEYIRRLVARDLGEPGPRVALESVFDLGRSTAADVALQKDSMVDAAVAEGRPVRGKRR